MESSHTPDIFQKLQLNNSSEKELYSKSKVECRPDMSGKFLYGYGWQNKPFNIIYVLCFIIAI